MEHVMRFADLGEDAVIPGCPTCGEVPTACRLEITSGPEFEPFPDITVAMRDIVTDFNLLPCGHALSRVTWTSKRRLLRRRSYRYIFSFEEA